MNAHRIEALRELIEKAQAFHGEMNDACAEWDQAETDMVPEHLPAHVWENIGDQLYSCATMADHIQKQLRLATTELRMASQPT